MPSVHLIEDLRVDLAFDTEDEALNGAARWETLLKGRLLAVAEEVFDDMSRPGEILRFERLTVDLGRAHPGTSGPELAQRMRDGLIAAMRDGLRGISGERSEAAQVLTRSHAALEQLTGFLASGQMPWHAGRSARADIEELMRRVLSANSRTFGVWLRTVAPGSPVLRRLAHQFSTELLVQVAAVLVPGRSQFVSALAQLLGDVFTDDDAGSTTRPRAQALVWEALLAILVDLGPGRIDDPMVARAAIKGVARLRGSGNTATAAALRGARVRLHTLREPTFDDGGALVALRAAMSPDAVAARPASPTLAIRVAAPVGDAAETPRTAIISPDPIECRAVLEHALSTGEMGALNERWRGLVTAYPGLVVEIVRRRGVLARTRRLIALAFSEPMLLDLVGLLEPGHARFIEALVHRLDRLPLTAEDYPALSIARRRRLWEFALGQVLVEQGVTFDRKAFLDSVARQSMVCFEVERGALLAAVTSEQRFPAGADATSIEVAGLLHDAIRDVAIEEGVRHPLRAADDAILEGARAYEAAIGRLFRRGRPLAADRETLVELLGCLASVAPTQLMRLVRELEVTAPPAPVLARNLTPQELRCLVIAIVAGSDGQSQALAPEFVDALDLSAARASDRHGFLTAVLSDALQRRPIDFQACAARSSRHPSVDQTLLSIDETSEARRRPRDSGVLVRAWILDGHPSLISGDWQLLVRERPSLLRALIRRYCRSTSVRARLVATSTPQMLRDIADLFEPALRGFGAGTTTGTVRDADLHAVFEKLFGDVPGAKILAAGKVHRRNTAAVANPPRSPRVGSAVELPANGDGEGTAANTETDLPKTSRPGEHLSANSAQHVHAVAGLLQAGRRLSTGERQALREGIDQGLASSPQALKRTLSVALEDPASIRRLVGLLPESTLTRLLVILQPFAYVRVLQCANRIATAALARVRDDPESSTTFPRLAPDATAKRAGRAEATPRQIARWKWQFILEYLLAEGRPFDPARFAAGCVERLRRHSGGKRREALRNRVLQDLASPGGPDDQALVQAMAEALRRPVIARRPAPRNSAQHVHAVAGLLQAGRRLSTGERQALREGIDQGLASSPQALKRTLSVALEDPASIRRLVGLLPESTLTRLLVILQPFAYVRVLQCANRIATAALARVRDDPESSTTFPRLAPDATAKRAGRAEATPRQIARWKWQFILEYLLAEGRPFDPARFAAGCVERLRRHSGGKRREALRNRVLQDLASPGGPDDQALVQAMAEALRRPVIARRPAPGGARRTSSREPVRAGHAGTSPLEAIFVANAGQVLAAPYLPRLFEMLSLTERGAFRDAGAAERAIHLLQFMVDGRVYAPEHQLMLNKILCGVQLDEPIVRDVGLTDAERAAAESLMQGMIRNWSALGKTSVAGLRETFLQRDGNLRLGDDAWSLLVEPRAFDMLLDRCPWSFAIIRLPWMHQVLHVEWR